LTQVENMATREACVYTLDCPSKKRKRWHAGFLMSKSDDSMDLVDRSGVVQSTMISKTRRWGNGFSYSEARHRLAEEPSDPAFFAMDERITVQLDAYVEPPRRVEERPRVGFIAPPRIPVEASPLKEDTHEEEPTFEAPIKRRQPLVFFAPTLEGASRKKPSSDLSEEEDDDVVLIESQPPRRTKRFVAPAQKKKSVSFAPAVQSLPRVALITTAKRTREELTPTGYLNRWEAAVRLILCNEKGIMSQVVVRLVMRLLDVNDALRITIAADSLAQRHLLTKMLSIGNDYCDTKKKVDASTV